MHEFLPKVALLALLGGGFVATGDLRRLSAQASGLLAKAAAFAPVQGGAAPADGPLPPGPAASVSAVASPSPVAAPAPVAPPPPTTLAQHDPEAPIPATAADHVPRMPPPGTGPERVDLARLRPGAQILVWVASDRGPQQIIVDLVEPATGEALLRRAGAADTPAARVTIRGSGTTLVRQGRLECRPAGLVHDATAAAPAETHGPILALAIPR